jgi:hypothetical protein
MDSARSRAFFRSFFVLSLGLSLHAHASLLHEVALDEEGNQAVSSAAPEAKHNVFLSLLTRAETADQLAALNTKGPRAVPGQVPPMGDHSASHPANGANVGPLTGDGLVVLLIVAVLVWLLSFRR